MVKRGWPKEGYRHGLSARRIKTARDREVNAYGITLDKSLIATKKELLEVRNDMFKMANIIATNYYNRKGAKVNIYLSDPKHGFPISIRLFAGRMPIKERLLSTPEIYWWKNEIAKIDVFLPDEHKTYVEIDVKDEISLNIIYNILQSKLTHSKWDKYEIKVRGV